MLSYVDAIEYRTATIAEIMIATAADATSAAMKTFADDDFAGRTAYGDARRAELLADGFAPEQVNEIMDNAAAAIILDRYDASK